MFRAIGVAFTQLVLSAFAGEEYAAFNTRVLTRADQTRIQINGLTCSSHAKSRALFCMKPAQIQKLQDFGELKQFVQEFPSMIEELGLADATSHFGWDKIFHSNLSAVVFEPALKEPSLVIEHGTGDPIPKAEFGLYFRIPVPFTIEQLRKWGREKGLKWWVEILQKKYLERSYSSEELRRCSQEPDFFRFYTHGAIYIAEASKTEEPEGTQLDELLDSAVRPVLSDQATGDCAQSKKAFDETEFVKCDSFHKAGRCLKRSRTLRRSSI